jgi:hypothetical protein
MFLKYDKILSYFLTKEHFFKKIILRKWKRKLNINYSSWMQISTLE